jgi:hypothetical protein
VSANRQDGNPNRSQSLADLITAGLECRFKSLGELDAIGNHHPPPSIGCLHLAGGWYSYAQGVVDQYRQHVIVCGQSRRKSVGCFVVTVIVRKKNDQMIMECDVRRTPESIV